MVEALIRLIVVVAVCIVIWMVAQRFSPDPLITKIIQIVVFVIAIIACISLLVPIIRI